MHEKRASRVGRPTVTSEDATTVNIDKSVSGSNSPVCPPSPRARSHSGNSSSLPRARRKSTAVTMSNGPAKKVVREYEDWKPKDVAKWLQAVKLGDYAKAALKSKVDGALLARVADAPYSPDSAFLTGALGIEMVGHIKKLQGEIKKLNKGESHSDESEQHTKSTSKESGKDNNSNGSSPRNATNSADSEVVDPSDAGGDTGKTKKQPPNVPRLHSSPMPQLVVTSQAGATGGMPSPNRLRRLVHSMGANTATANAVVTPAAAGGTESGAQTSPRCGSQPPSPSTRLGRSSKASSTTPSPCNSSSLSAIDGPLSSDGLPVTHNGGDQVVGRWRSGSREGRPGVTGGSAVSLWHSPSSSSSSSWIGRSPPTKASQNDEQSSPESSTSSLSSVFEVTNMCMSLAFCAMFGQVAIKCVLDDDVSLIRLNVETDLNFAALQRSLKAVYGGPMKVNYFAQDGSNMAITNDSTLQYSYEDWTQRQRSNATVSWRFYIVPEWDK